MSCDAAAAGLIWLASFHPGVGGAQPQLIPAAATQPQVNALSKEPLYADIISRAAGLKTVVAEYRKDDAGTLKPLPSFEAFKSRIDALSALDMKGHLDLAKRGTDGDLKCILKGISQDLPRKLAELAAAPTPKARDTAMEEMFYLLRDNVEVITAPPIPTV